MFSLKYENLLEREKNPYTYGSKKNKKILKKMKIALPELMTKNLKLGQELKNRITISSFMNETDTKAKKYLKKFLLSSQNRVKNTKIGLGLINAVQKGSGNLSSLYNQINNDLYMKNGDFLIQKKNLLMEKTDQEKHDKINNLINNIKYIIKPIKINKKSNSHRIVKSVSETEMNKAKNIIFKEISDDKNIIKDKINYYRKSLITLAESKPKKFNKIAKNIYFKSNLKMINYSKPSNLIKEKEMLNILNIRRELLRSKGKKNKKDELNEKYFESDTNKNIPISENKGDTILVIKELAKNNNKLEVNTKKNMRKINSMIDLKLPFFKNYDRTINYCNKLNISLSLSEIGTNKPILFKFKNDQANKIELLKNEIKKNLTYDKIRKGCEEIERNKNIITSYNY